MSVVSSDPLRLGVLGCSSIAQRSIIPAIQASDGLTLGAVASRSPAQAADWAERLGCQGLSYEELMASDELDAVYVSVPTGLHAAWGRKVLSHGKHLLLEKSFTTTLEETRELLALAAQHDLVAMEALAYVHHPFVQTIHALLQSGRLGAIRHVDARFGFPDRSDEDIRYRRELGGGAILDTLIYPLSFCLDIDPQPFLNVSAHVINHPR